MTDDDLERMRSPSPRWLPGCRCAVCHGSPTCPQLHDSLWRALWIESQWRLQPLGCTCGAENPEVPAKWRPTGEDHHQICELRRGRREMLCLECAEQALGRRLTLGDLLPCMGNYAHYVMQVRAVHGLEITDLAGVGSVDDPASDGVPLANDEADDTRKEPSPTRPERAGRRTLEP